ncbi:hypothetical protein N0V94_005765 [Neodidymelliopsis sp. IMI 364377]|nr:hypothetical protein N0V94_005765 [Neodidymelliopsis sp. IMI 364377]
MKPVAGYVDSSILEAEELIPFSSDDSESEEDDIDDIPRGRTDKTKRKRKRSPSPASPQIRPMIYNQHLEELTDDENGGAFHRRTPKKPPITLRFDVPLGYHGPLLVKLDPAILKSEGEGAVRGCSILYGENTFAFERHEATRGTFYEHELKEIGYQDALHFLKMIGPENIQYLRDLKIVFNDARPSDTPHATSNEDRRYMTDGVLINYLRILRHAKLRKLSLAFMGRRNLQRSDVKFLGYLEQIKVDELEKWFQPRSYYFEHKIRSNVWAELIERMVRKKKLYDTK